MQQENELIAEQKKILRRRMIKQRDGLTSADCEIAAEHLHHALIDLLKKLPDVQSGQPLRIGVYSAIRNEADLSASWQSLVNWPARLYFPAVSGRGEDARLVLASLPEGKMPAEFLVPGRFGIAEPPQDAWMDEPPELDLILIPGVAFDRYGNRLGWGKSFYDRLLTTIPGHPLRVGVCYRFQMIEDRLPVVEEDQPIDWILTPEGSIRI